MFSKMPFLYLQVIVLILLTIEGQVPQDLCQPSRFRSADGSCNNIRNPTWGKSMEPYRRFLPPAYADGVSRPRVGVDGSSLSNPRVVSLAVAVDSKRDSPSMTTMFTTWGLLLTMETTRLQNVPGPAGATLDCCGRDRRNPDCIPIMLPVNDPFFSTFRVPCMQMARSTARQDPSRSVFREQINNNEAFISGSPVYGSTAIDANRLRTFRDGKLRTSQFSVPHTDLLPQNTDQCGPVHCFLAGDKRVNLTPEVGCLNTLFVRHHNRLADELRAINPSWADERIYQESRRIIGAIIQLVTYRDFLPLLLGTRNMKGFELELLSSGHYKGYDSNINPTIANVFGAAAFRFGHSTIVQSYDRLDSSSRALPSPPFSHTLLDPEELHQGKLDSIVRGLMEEKMSEVDQFFTKEVTEHLFETLNRPGSGQDLFAINIQRGREHGLPGYNVWREFCRLERVTSFDQMARIMPSQVAAIFKKLYKSVDDVDLYPAGVSEHHVQGGSVGPTFACIIASQFRNLRRGDQFWFENGGHLGAFSPEQLAEIRKMTLNDIICANSQTIQQTPHNVFIVAKGAQPVQCQNVRRPILNPQAWKDTSA